MNNFGSAEAVFEKQNIKEIPNLASEVRKALLTGSLLSAAEVELKNMREHRIKGRFVLDEDYPYRLRECEDAPIMLYSRGFNELNAQKVLAVVGTRNATPLGKETTQLLIKDLANQIPGVLIVSGLAYGIDVIAHQSAMLYGLKTVAVFAHGLHEVYPSSHRRIADEMAERGGALLSEYPWGIPSLSYRFRERNRIIAGMSDASIIVESDLRGGSLITARYARDYNRDVLAFPGRNIDRYSSGCNQQIKQRSAALVESAEDVLREMNWTSPIQKKVKQQKLFMELPKSQKMILDLLKIGEILTANDLSIQTSLKVNEILAHMLELEMEGLTETLPGGCFRRKTI
ncbi:MAG TPA: DNA-processing protein DprA [Bacteroidales bacterium]|nr:DNA-processing protein DprA [Bacteroidales bacterium]